MSHKTITLKQVGWRVSGTAILNLYGGGQATVCMRSTFIPFGHMTKETLHRSINDGQFGCDSIQSAVLSISDEYEHGVLLFNRDFTINNPNPLLVCRGI